jgi:undecaprenyl-diphosphatase
VVQALAIFPVISRSGSTILLGLCLCIRWEEGAHFSFLMVLWAIAGAMLCEVKDMFAMGIRMSCCLSLLVGFLTSFISGYFALKYLIIMLRTKGIHPFAWYCWAIGLTGLIYFW